jgi:hypothetical protein
MPKKHVRLPEVPIRLPKKTKEVAILPKVDVRMHKDAVRLDEVTFRGLKWPLDFLKLP